MPIRQIVFQSEHLTVVYVEQGSSTVIATFNEAGSVANEDFYAESGALEAIGATVIGFVSTKANWYPAQDMLAAIGTVRTHIAGRRIITFGLGQGGYGSLKYAARLSAEASVGFSPQFSINPVDVEEFDRRFTGSYNAVLKNGERIEAADLAPQNFIFFDTLEKQDAAQAERLLELGRMTAVPMPFAGHYSFRQVSHSGAAPDFFRLCMGDASALDFRRLIRGTRGFSKDYVERSVSRLGESVQRHRGLFLAAAQRLPAGPNQSVAMIQLHLAYGDWVKAERALKALSNDELLTADIARVWRIFRRASFDVGERRIAGLFARRYPNDVYMRQIGVDAMIRVGLTEEAIAELQTLQAMPDAAAQMQRFIQYYGLLKRSDLVSAFVDTMLASGAMSVAERVRIGFEIAESCLLQKTRPEALRELIRIRVVSSGDDEVAFRLIEFAVRAEEFGFVADIVFANPHLSAKYPVVDVYAAQSVLAKDAMDGDKALEALFRIEVKDAVFWDKLAWACLKPLGPTRALRAIRQAISLTPEPVPAALTLRLVFILFHGSHYRKAAHEMKKLIGTPDATGHAAGVLVHLALSMKNNALARRFATDWLRAHPAETSDPGELMEACRLLLKLREMHELLARIEALLARVEAGLSMPKVQFEELVEMTQAVGFDLEQRAVAVALRQYPGEKCFQALSKRERTRFAKTLFGSPKVVQQNGL